ncbi:MAG: cystine ABC transporter substrate-binding protein [Caenispirillum sp.]|nr:cystine ABC transporter substrate-binding protein [Caenispirillum sp.]
MQLSRLRGLVAAATLAAAGLGLGAGAAAAQDKSLLDQIKERGSILIGVEGTYPPFNYTDEKGELIGFEVDFAKAVAEEMGVKAEFVPTKWDGMLAGLDSERFDAIMNQVTITPEREQKYDFTQPYTVSGIQIITTKDKADELTTPQALEGQAVGVGLGTNYEEWLRENAPGADVRTYEGNVASLQDLRVGRLDALLNDRLMAGYLLRQSDGSVVAAGEPFAKQRMGIAIRKGNPELQKALNDAVDSLRQSGELAEISKEWFGSDVTQ